ncbi:glycosyltransferase family 4 protein [Providencia sp. PROV250]|uniref:glycosyltransferase family 4 protein n=1 Tax=Providencia TaxID=586 RepID=UPI00234925EE|nr:glycosyltransferase family 4 protein [Providencia sp. PROV250]
MKKIIYVHDLHFYRLGSCLYTSSNIPEIYFNRFFGAEECEISIFSRLINLKSIEELPQGYEVIKNKNIKIIEIAPKNYLSIFNIKLILKFSLEIKNNDFLVANIPSILGIFSLIINTFAKKPFSVEVAADYDQFSSKKGGFCVSLIMKPLMTYFIKNAKGAAYVSQFLKEKYPSYGQYVISSNVNIESISKKEYKYRPEHLEITFIGGLNERKGVFNLLESIKIIKNKTDKKIVINLIGGHHDRNWNKIVKDLKIENLVIFYGILTKTKIIEILDRSDLYIQPSLTEGIPRATLEAMSRGLPVVATKLPGFSEILDEEVLVNTNSSKELAEKILTLSRDENKLKSLSYRNRKRAKDFTYEILHNKRKKFYQEVLGKE